MTLRLRRRREQEEGKAPEQAPELSGEEGAPNLPPPPLVTVGPLSEPSVAASEDESSNEADG